MKLQAMLFVKLDHSPCPLCNLFFVFLIIGISCVTNIRKLKSRSVLLLDRQIISPHQEHIHISHNVSIMKNNLNNFKPFPLDYGIPGESFSNMFDTLLENVLNCIVISCTATFHFPNLSWIVPMWTRVAHLHCIYHLECMNVSRLDHC